MGLIALNDNRLRVWIDAIDNMGTRSRVTDATPKVTICEQEANDVPITGATNASPIVVTQVAHGYTDGQVIVVWDVYGNHAANGVWTVANKTDDTYELAGSTGSGTFLSVGDRATYLSVVAETAIAHVSNGMYAVEFQASFGLVKGVYYTFFIRDTGSYAGDYFRKYLKRTGP